MNQERFRQAVTTEAVTPGLDAAALRHDFVAKLYLELAKFPGVASHNDKYLALAYAVRDRLLERWVRSASTYLERQSKTVIYLSAEFLPGPQLANAVLNLGLGDAVREAMTQLGLDYAALAEHEEEPGLGNGGLGRLAACFMDSLATLELPAIVLVATVSGVGGGLMRDMLAGDIPELLRPGQYNTLLVVIAAVTYMKLAYSTDTDRLLAAWVTIFAFFVARLLTIHFNWRSRPLHDFHAGQMVRGWASWLPGIRGGKEE